MKKIIVFFAIFLVIFSGTFISFAEPENVAQPDNTQAVNGNNSAQTVLDSISGTDINNAVNKVGNTAMGVGQNILDQIASWSLPICSLLVVFGAVQYFILGIRNLYKKRQGLLLMWGSITFYVIVVFVNLIITFMTGIK